MTLQVKSHITLPDNPKKKERELFASPLYLNNVKNKMALIVQAKCLFQGTLVVWQEETPYLPVNDKMWSQVEEVGLTFQALITCGHR